MTSLQQSRPAARRRLAAMLAPTALLLVVAGTVGLVKSTSAADVILAAAVLAVAILLCLMAGGLAYSAHLDERPHTVPEQEADCCGDCVASDDCAVKALPRL